MPVPTNLFEISRETAVPTIEPRMTFFQRDMEYPLPYYPRNYFTQEDQEAISRIARDIISGITNAAENFKAKGAIDTKTARYYYHKEPLGDFLGLGDLYGTTQCKFMERPVGSQFCTNHCDYFVMINEIQHYVVCKKCKEGKKEFEI